MRRILQWHIAWRDAGLGLGSEKPPIICDESLAQYDDDRALACLQYLDELGQEYQVLLLDLPRARAEGGR